jgi:hypothetical protein
VLRRRSAVLGRLDLMERLWWVQESSDAGDDGD